jgi:hypothetical protein
MGMSHSYSVVDLVLSSSETLGFDLQHYKKKKKKKSPSTFIFLVQCFQSYLNWTLQPQTSQETINLQCPYSHFASALHYILGILKLAR